MRLIARWNCFLKEEIGSSLVEYLIVFMIFMAMLLAIADFSRALYAYHFVSSAAREATRYAIVRGSTCSNDLSCTAANSASGTAGPTSQDDIAAFVQKTPLGINPANIAVTANWVAPSGSSMTCGNTQTTENPGCTVEVTVNYNFTFMFPFVSKTTLPMTSTSQMTVTH
jgi:Flp pilus assembly protein TadG